MDKVIHRSESRGFADHGWLKTYQTFSYANYYDPRRIHFGALRVLNDDRIEGGEGFNSYPHDNLEIIHIPLKGVMEQMDSVGNVYVVRPGEVQILSAGTGIIRNLYNQSLSEPLEYLQIWLFPSEYDLPPQCEKVKLPKSVKNELQLITGPADDPDTDVGYIYQMAWLYTAELDAGATVSHTIHSPRHGAYIFVIEGSVIIDGTKLKRRDGLGLWNTEGFDVKAYSSSRILVIEVPMRKL